MKTAKVVTIDYLKNIKKEKQNILDFHFSLEISNQIVQINNVIKMVKESEGE